VAVTTLEPPGSAVVTKVAFPVFGFDGEYGTFRVAVPKTVLECKLPLVMVAKLTMPTPLAGVTATAKLTLAPTLTLVAEGVIVIELAVREAAHAVKSVLALTEPSPVTWS
jgi:hypothetical protein